MIGGKSKKSEFEAERRRTFDIVGAPMPVYALQIITVATEFAGRHTAYILECRHFVLIGYVEMIVGTWVVRTVTS